MNYIAEMNAFYDFIAINGLSTGQIALWHALMGVNNKCAWKEWFTVSNSVLQLQSGLSRDGVYKIRRILKELGLIDFKESKNSKASKYRMNSLLIFLQSPLQDSIQPSLPLDKQKENKQNNYVSVKTKEKLSPIWKTCFEQFWEEYPKKQDKDKVKQWFLKNNEKKINPDDLLFSLRKYKKSSQWVSEDGRFIPNPMTWLDGERWKKTLLPRKTIPVYKTSYDLNEVENSLVDLFKRNS